MQRPAQYWIASAIKILLIFGLCVVCTWMGLGRGYDDGTEAGVRNGYVLGFRAGHRTGWRSAATELGSPELPAPKVYPVASSHK